MPQTESRGKQEALYRGSLLFLPSTVLQPCSPSTVENKTLPRISPLSVLPSRSDRRRVQAIFSHAAGENSTLLNFQEGDLILLLVTEARDGWHYGENETTKM